MRLRRLFIPTAFAVAAVVVAFSHPPRLESAPAASGAAREVARIRVHFDSVLMELSQRDLSALSAGQRNRRATLVATLVTYRNNGAFPHNYDFPGQAVPYFVDRKTGVLCAVAHLLESTGRRDIVDRVSASDNNVWVAQLGSDTAFIGWLSTNGITLAEAARIQVPYQQPVSNAEVARNVAFVAAAPFAIGGATVTSLINMIGNADGHHTTVNKIGLVTGIMTSVMGATLLAKNDIPSSVGATALAVGGASIALSTRAMRRNATIVSEREAAQHRAVAAATLTPTMDAKGGAGARMAVTIDF